MIYLSFSDEPEKAKTELSTDPPDVLEQEEYDTGAEVSHVLTLLMPWVIAVLLHVGVMLMTVFVVWSVPASNAGEEDTTVPVSKMENDRPSELLTYSEDLDVPATTDIPRDVQTQEVAKGDPLSALSADTADNLALIGVEGSKALPLGSKVGKDPLGVGMYGAGGNARTIVYVVDASGSLIESLAFVVNELKDSIRRLDGRRQKFTIIFFQKDRAIEVPVPHQGMKRATQDAISQVSKWITLENGFIVPQGSSSPVKAIERALSYKPDLIYLLSDNITGKGVYAVDQQDLLDLIQSVKKRKNTERTRINTIQFLSPDELGTLKEIARQNGGIYRFVSESDVGR